MKTMKKNRRSSKIIRFRRPIYGYPNSASAAYFWNRLLDGALTVVTGMGAVTVLAFLLTV